MHWWLGIHWRSLLKLFDSPMSFNAAQSECQRNNANLASIHSEEVNTKLREMCELGSLDQCWIGLHQPNGEGGKDSWRWIADSSAPIYTNWALHEPNAGNDDKINSATIFNSGKEPKAFVGGCGALALLVCSIASSMSVLGVSGAGKGLCPISCECDNQSMIKCGHCGDGVCGSLLAVYSLILVLIAKRSDAAIIAFLAAIAMCVASGFGRFAQPPEDIVGQPIPFQLARMLQCTRVSKILICLAATFSIVGLILRLLAPLAGEKVPDNDDIARAKGSLNFTLRAASHDHCGWALYLKKGDDGSNDGNSDGSSDGNVVAGKVAGLFNGGRRLLGGDATCSEIVVRVHSPSGTLVYETSRINMVGFVDTCGSDDERWMKRNHPKLKHLGRFFLYTDPRTQTKEAGSYRVSSTSSLYAYDYCAEFEEPTGSVAAGLVLGIGGILCLCAGGVIGIVACCCCCGPCQPSVNANVQPAVGPTIIVGSREHYVVS